MPPLSKLLCAAALLAATLPAFSQPLNDDCATATALTVSTGAVCNALTDGTTENAGTSPLSPCPECPAGPDVWYRFTATNTVHIVQVSDARTVQGYTFHSRLRLSAFYDGSCGSLVPMNQEAEFYDQASLALGNLTLGQTYYLRVLGPENNADYPVRFKICANTPLRPANDECAGAALIQVSPGTGCTSSAAGTFFGATPSRTDCAGQSVADVWYTFTATGAAHRVQLNPNVGVSGYGFELYTGGECGQLAALGCAQGAFPGRTFEGLISGTTYYLRVFGAIYQYPDFQVCIVTMPPPPANDECANALPLEVNPGYQTSTYTYGSTLGATSSQTNCGGTESTHDVWYSFQATAPTHRLQFAYISNIFGQQQDAGFEVYQGECGSLSSLACGSLNQLGAVVGGLTPGDAYRVRVYSLRSSNHNFELSVQTLPPPPVNLTCATATTLTSGPLPNCGTPLQGSTEGVVLAQPSASCNSQGAGMFVWYTFQAEQPVHVVQLQGGVTTQYGNYGEWWVEVHEGDDCGNLKELGCYGYFEVVNGLFLKNLTVGGTYYVRFGSPFAAAHSFQICLGHYPQPVNDDCANALPLTVHGDLNCLYPSSGITASSTASQPVSACLGGKNDVWFRFKAIQRTQRVALSEQASLEDGSTYQPLNAELLGGTCGNLSSLQCWSEVGQGNNNSVLYLADLEPGQTYYLRFAHAENVLMSFKVCLLTPPPPPANDRCADAVALPVAAPGESCEPTDGTTQYASTAPTLPALCCFRGDVWYSFAATRASHEVRLSEVSGWFESGGNALPYAGVEVYAAPCGSGKRLMQQNVYYTDVVKLSNLSPGATYFVRVYPQDGQYVRFNICIGTPAAPANDECVGALPFQASDNLDCFSQQFDTEGATPSQPGCGGVVAGDLWYQFTATATAYVFDCSMTYDAVPGSRGMEILSGDCGGPLLSFSCKKLSAQREIWEQGGFTPGSTYYVRLWSEAAQPQRWEICTRALPAPPTNDDCAQALPLPVNKVLPCTAPTLGTTLGATQSRLGCTGEAGRDVWYAFTAESVANLLEIRLEQSYLYSDGRIGVEVLAGGCADATSVFCQNNVTDSGYEILPDLTVGQPYLLRVFNAPLQANDFSLCLSALPKPANDDCAQAAVAAVNADLTCALTTPGTTAGASAEGSATQPDVWYTFTALGTQHLIELHNLITLYGWTHSWHWQVYRGNSCAQSDLLSENEERVTGLTPGQTYSIRVFSAEPETAFKFDLCIRTLPPAPANTACATAQPLPVNPNLVCAQVLHGTTAGLLGEPGYGTGCNYYTQLRPIYEMWYSFTALSPNHRVRATNVVPVISNNAGWYFGLMALESSDCGQFQSLGCTNHEGELLLQNLTPGQTYYVVVFNYENGSRFDFDLCVTTHPVPPNDLCANALPLTIEPDEQCAAPTLGTTFSATTSPEPTDCLQPAADVWYTFTATHTAHTLRLAEAYGDEVVFLEMYSGDCGQLKKLFCYFQPQLPYDITLGDLTPGASYWVRIGGKNAHFAFCILTPTAAAPANDRCADATTLAVSPEPSCAAPVAGSTFGATPSVPMPQAFFYQQYRPSNDVWYRFTATQPNHAVVLSNLSGNTDYLEVAAYAGVCGSLTPVNGTRLYDSKNELKLLGLTPGEVYSVRVSTHPFVPQTFGICVVSLPVPLNDECAGAIFLPENTDFDCQLRPLAAIGWATQSQPNCTGGKAYDVWYKWVATATDYRLDVGRYQPSGVYPKFGLEVLEGDCGGTLSVVLPCAEQTEAKVELHQLSVGKTYYLRLYADPFDRLETDICLRTLPAPPANDDCAQATVIQASSDPNCGGAYTGTTLSGTPSGKNCEGTENTSDVWYRFTASSAEMFLEMTQTRCYFDCNGSIGFALYRGDDCGNLSELGCFYVYGMPPTLPKLEVGATYYVRVFSPKGTAHDFTLCLQNVPTNTDCATALRVFASADEQCGQPTSGSTAGLSETVFSYCENTYYHTALWYRFTATSSIHILRLENVTNQYGSDYLNMELLEGCFHQRYCGREIFTTNLTPGQDYYIRVVGSINSGSRFELCVTTPQQPDNDNCPGAVTLPVSPLFDCTATTPGMTLGATASFNKFDCKSGPDVLYRFTATDTRQYIRFSNVEPESSENFVEVLQGPCGDWAATLGCYPLYPELLVSGFIPGETYYLRIGSPSVIEHFRFEVCVATPQPDPYVSALYPWNNGCQPTTNEGVSVYFGNGGAGSIPAGAAQFTLTLTGANTGTYGPISNPEAVEGQSQTTLFFNDIDLSKPGETVLAVTMTALNDPSPDNNTASTLFTDLPPTTFFRDADGDGYGDSTLTTEACQPPAGYVFDNTDCDDNEPARNPAALEICDGLDNDCDGLIDAADPSLVDPAPPSIACPADLTVSNAPGLCEAPVQYSISTDDNCGYTVSQFKGLPSGAVFPIGTTLNIFTLNGPNGSVSECAFSVTVEKTADPALSSAYVIIGLNDVFLQKNTVQGGGVGATGAGKKVRLEGGTDITASNTFVKASALELGGGSQVGTALTGPVSTALLPVFKANLLPGNNNLSIPNNNGSWVTLPLANYGTITVGLNSSVIFSGNSSVRVRELVLKEGATVLFAQNTELLVNNVLSIGRNVRFNPGGGSVVQGFVRKNITVSSGAEVWADLYTQQDLRLEKASEAQPTIMAGRFIANNVYALDFAQWNWDPVRCVMPTTAITALAVERDGLAAPAVLSKMQISPNPASERVQLSFSLEMADEVTLRLLNAAGQIVRTERWAGATGENQFALYLGDLPEGLYVVQVLAEGQRWTEKLSVLRD